ncbi:MAG TPA: formyltransferase family protein, partial [Bradyrhizobium sp.]|nr:formyltransferase family protein [Bradyrhizobium sp.]
MVRRVHRVPQAMFDTVILLSGDAELSVLPHVLIGHNAFLKVIKAKTSFDLTVLNSELLARSRLIAFVTGEIVPASILNRLGYGAFNFHPGPPSYPGWAPAHFALYNRENQFGVTAHVMIEQVDAGPIIDLTLFPIPADISVLGLEGLAYAHLAHLFWRMAPWLATDASPPSTRPIEWGPKKYSRRNYRDICDIPLDIGREEFERRIQVFGGNHFGVMPTIHLHGVEFRAVIPTANQGLGGTPFTP